ncbi:MAG TPA: divergent polysaccharide deacetylase family protein [Magnetovibrio sp.]
MKLPFVNKLDGMKGAFARLNPMGLVAKIKARKNAAQSDEDDGDFDTSFDDLGDLDELDAVAREGGEQEVDYTTDEYTTDSQVNLDGLTAGGAIEQEKVPGDFADLDAEDAEAEDGEDEEVFDLAELEAMPGFDDDEEEDEEAEAAAKKKKLLMIAGGGIAAAVLIGAGGWLVMGDSGSQDEAAVPATSAPMANQHGAVVSLDNIPMVSAEPPKPVQATPAHTPDGTPPPAGDVAVVDEAGEESPLAQLGLNVAQEPGAGVVVPSVTKASFAAVAPAPSGTALSVAPDAALVEQTDLGLLPKIGPDGRTVYDVYARPAPALDAAKPKLAIIVTGLGLSRAATETAITAMPETVTLALNVYARGLDFWVARAREDGHEVLLSVPLEAEGFPYTDPGPEALRVLDAPEANVAKLAYILSRTTGYFGVLSDYGGKFLTVEEQVDAMMTQLKERGVMYVDGGVQGSLGTRSAYKMNIPWAAVEINLDESQGREALQQQLQALSDLAQKRSVAIARVSATPLSMSLINAWIAGLDQQGFQLVPVSALAKKQLIR